MNSQVRVATVAVSAQTIANAGRNVTILWMVVAGLAGLLALDGCGHAHGVEHADPNAASAESSSGKAPNSTPPADHPVRASKTEAHAEPASDTKTAAPSEVPLSSSPSGLLQSGAAKQIQERLAALGFLDDRLNVGAQAPVLQRGYEHHELLGHLAGRRVVGDVLAEHRRDVLAQHERQGSGG